MNRAGSEEIFNRSILSIPGGVNSPVRAFKAVGGTPPIIADGHGCRIKDIDGNDYIDYIGSWGPLILGHSHPKVLNAVTEALKHGSSYGLPSVVECLLAEEIKRRVPSIEMIRFVNSGTEAAMSAIRLARAFTHKDKIIKFSGCYHGHHDSFLVAAGSGAATYGVPDSSGVTRGTAADTLIADYNDLDSVIRLLEHSHNEIAAIIVEPVAGNMGVIPPNSGFLNGLRKLCNRHDCLLIFDEVMTGFRIARGGAQELYGINPDLTLFGKIIGGGFPVGAFGGKADIMSLLAPSGTVYQAGTLSGNPIAMTAGLHTLQLLDNQVYQNLEGVSAKLATGLVETSAAYKIAVALNRVGSMLTLFFSDKPVTDFSSAKSSNHSKFEKFFHGMYDNGILLPPSGFEAWFVSAAHSDSDINRTIEVSDQVFRNMANSLD